MSGEYEPLLTCLRDEPGRDSRLCCFSHEDWHCVLHVARRHALTPLLFDHLCDSGVPADVRETLERAYYSSTARNMRIHVQLREVLSLLCRNGISVIVLKGCDFAEFVYSKPGLRPMTDIDLLADAEDIAVIGRLLEAHGYYTDIGATGASGKHAVPYLREHDVPVELHYHIAEPPFAQNIDLAGIRARAVSREGDDCTIRCLCPEDRILYLALHACIGHGLDNGLLPFVDMQQALRVDGPDLDLNILSDRAREWGVERALSLMLSLYVRFMRGSSTVPQMPLPVVDPGVLDAAESFVLDRTYRMPEGFVQVLLAGSWSRKWEIIKQRIIPSAALPDNRDHRFTGIAKRLLVLVCKYSRSVVVGVFRYRHVLQRIRREQQRRVLIEWMGGSPRL